jgi:UDP-N-acetylglucosamine acyltransferase
MKTQEIATQLTKTTIHETAVVHSGAEIGVGVTVGPFCVIGPDVQIGDGTQIDAHVVIQQWTRIGTNCQVGCGSVLGGAPQDHKFRGERSYLIIGDNTIIREYNTIHRACGEEMATSIGNDDMLMAYCHIGHNCYIGNHIVMANMVGISGHVVVEDRVVFGGMVGVHQYVRIGKLAMVGGYSKVAQDIPPFMMADGRPTRVCDLNIIGLRRSGVPPKVRAGLKQAYKLLYRSNMNITQAIEAIEATESELEPSEEMDYLLEFLRNIKFGFGGRQLEVRRK